ncbi:MAG: SDR family NAD(P)-dependent oxidoreductase [bacterium]|nr:SDR family NAD(P)-dependent oxidoreductase [bacterium]
MFATEQTNVFGLVRMCQLVLPEMRRKGWGRIINVSSMGGEMTIPFASFYHATKYAVESLSDGLRIEVQPFGIDVVVIQPGGINTPLGHQTVAAIPTEMGSAYAEALRGFRHVSNLAIQAAQMMVTPDQVAQVILEAIQADHPLTRYKVNTNDTRTVNQERDVTDRQRDAAFRQQFGLTNPQS